MSRSENLIADRHNSRLGIASVAIGVLVPTVLISLVVASIALGTRRGSIGNYFGIGFVFFGLFAPLLHLLGSILGFVGLLSKKTKNLFPAIGTILNTLLGIIGILIIWLILQNMSWGFR